ncbi:RNA polymerase sigma factor [Pseudoalteromonas sp. SWXJZ94C]|uniref:RNA polymerase sigma factor n=1 Tax=unclassified Pseudoalteromonas TaxID=194690 RepID=UPI0004087CD9|nr:MULTISPECIES: RNA polymerase sigma factor [unclassified Pseudoalteromonas]MBH0059342.1 RNA polymerase sigma factor [Pseudoalteromonas sp. SWXJZ94C]
MTKKVSFTSTFVDVSSQLKRFVSRIVQPDDVEDIVQETFIKSYEADLKQDIQFTRSYMLKTAKHLALNHIAKWDNKFSESLEHDSELPTLLKSMQLEDEYTSKERFLLFCKATEQLSSSIRKCFILKKVYGMSQKEIAEQMQLSQSTVEKHIAKGLLQTILYMREHDRNINAHSDNIPTSLQPLSTQRVAK